jgi:hypothetical protein
MDFLGILLAVNESGGRIMSFHSRFLVIGFLVAWSMPSQAQTQTRWFSVDFGLRDSSWSKIDPALRDTSYVGGFSLNQHLVDHVDGVVGARVIRGAGKEGPGYDIRSGYEFVGGLRGDLGERHFRPVLQGLMSFGGYRAWKDIGTSGDLTTFRRAGGGLLAGVQPAAGLALVTDDFRAQALLGYTHYFGQTARHIGGIDVTGSVAFPF